MTDIQNKYQCCGCTACGTICKVNAISFHDDQLGFKYPQINKILCINCGVCFNICPFNIKKRVTEKPANNYKQKAFAARHNNPSEIASSRSGAVFTALSDRVLLNSGVIYGAGFDSHFATIHKRSETKDKCSEFKGSKYTQSDINEIVKQVICDLKNGKTVLFSGTPCQIYCIKKVTPQRLQDKLITIDVICHGVASPKIWNEYLNFLENKEKNKITHVNFRDKEIFGWSGLHKESFTFSDGIKRTYHYTFYQPYLLRPSCHRCPFSNLNRCSDITIGDFWGIDKIDKSFNPNDTGCSLVICNTSKGESILKDASKDLRIKEFNLKDCLQPNLLHPTEEDKKRAIFERDYIAHGFKYVYFKYGNVGIRYYLNRIKNLIRRLWRLN